MQFGIKHVNEYYNHSITAPISLTASPLRTGTRVSDSAIKLRMCLMVKIRMCVGVMHFNPPPPKPNKHEMKHSGSIPSEECMCQLRNIAMREVTTKKMWPPDRHTDGQTDAVQSDPYVPLCFAGNKKGGMTRVLRGKLGGYATLWK